MLHLPIIIIILCAVRETLAKRAYVLAFALGLFFDLVLGNQLGLLAASYLIATLIVFLYKVRFKFTFFSLAIFLIVSEVIFFYARGIFR